MFDFDNFRQSYKPKIMIEIKVVKFENQQIERILTFSLISTQLVINE